MRAWGHQPEWGVRAARPGSVGAVGPACGEVGGGDGDELVVVLADALEERDLRELGDHVDGVGRACVAVGAHLVERGRSGTGRWPNGSPAIQDGSLQPPLSRTLTTAADDTRLVTICTGFFVLAAVGLLDGRPATTHGAYTQHFRSLFPDVELRPDVLYVDDDTILTSAGGAAGLDLCLHIVRRDHGSEVANRASRSCLVPPWREGNQAQFVEIPVPEVEDSTTGSPGVYRKTIRYEEGEFGERRAN